MRQAIAQACLAGWALGAADPSAALAPSVSRDEVRAIVAEMLSDGRSRTSLLQGGGAAGHDGKGFFLASGDGTFRLSVSGYMQVTYSLNVRDEPAGGGASNEVEPGFQVKRARLIFRGHAVTPDLTFGIMEELTNSATGAASLKDAWVEYAFADGWFIRGGQSKVPLLREELVADTAQLASERSAVNAVFTQDRSQLIEVGYRGPAWRFGAAFSDGLNSDNTPFAVAGGANNDLSVLPEADVGLTFRAEWTFMGSTDLLRDFTSQPGGAWSGQMGAAVHYQGSANAQGQTLPGGAGAVYNDLNYLTYTVDVQVEGGGFTGFIAFVGSRAVGRPGVNSGGESDEADDFGLVAQIGSRWGDVEPFFRYEGLFLDDDARTGRVFTASADTDDTLNFLTIGFNTYFAGNAARFTADAVVALEANDFSTAAGLPVGVGNFRGTASGLLPDSKGGQVAVRFQFQLMF